MVKGNEKKYGKEFCSVCFQLVDSNAAKASHILLKHMPPLFASKFCRFTAHSAEETIDHLKKHHKEQLESPSIYQYVTDTTADYEQEFEKAHSRSFRKGARASAEQRAPLEDVETEPINNHSCVLCLEDYSDKLKHVKEAHLVASRIHKCVKCSFTTKNTHQAVSHAVMWHKGKRVIRSRKRQYDDAKLYAFLSVCFPEDFKSKRACV